LLKRTKMFNINTLQKTKNKAQNNKDKKKNIVINNTLPSLLFFVQIFLIASFYN